MPIAVDFSSARPSIAELKANDVALVLRYLTGPDGKAITAAELAEYLDNGIAVGFVFEVGVNDIAGGAAAGRAHATQALAALAALGISGAVVYFAVDESVTPSAAVPYFQGINAVMDPAHVGDYGEGALCELLASLGLSTFHWQSESTSFDGNATTLPITALQQVFNGSPIPGTDKDVICRADVGQWPRPHPNPIPNVAPLFLSTPFGVIPVTQDTFNAIVRLAWYLIRTDEPSVSEFGLLWDFYKAPTSTVIFGKNGFGGSFDLVIANIHDTAGSALKP